MSQEHVELHRRVARAFDDKDPDALLALMDDQVEAVPRVTPMEGGLTGHEGIRQWWESVHATFPDFVTEVVEVRDLGDMTLADLRHRAHGAGSDTPVEQRSWHVAEWRNAKVVWWGAYATEADALEAARRRQS
jgi:ketosteroid isomerase-like protein